jgi:hypothetical protein
MALLKVWSFHFSCLGFVLLILQIRPHDKPDLFELSTTPAGLFYLNAQDLNYIAFALFFLTHQ